MKLHGTGDGRGRSPVSSGPGQVTHLIGLRRTRRDERGDTLIEVIIAVVIIGLTVSGFLGGLVDSISSSAKHRSHVTIDTVLKSFAEAARYDIQFRPLPAANPPAAPLFRDCATTYTVLGTPSPTSGLEGTATTIFGTGYEHSRPLTVTMTMVGGPSVVLDGGTSDRRGDVAVTVAAPSGPGPYTITVADDSNHHATSANTFTVTPGSPVPSTSLLAGYHLEMTIDWWNNTSQGQHFESSSTDSCPAADHSGIQKVILTVTAPDGTSGTLDFIVVNPDGLPPSITSPDHTTFYEGRSRRTFTVTATGYPNPRFTETGLLPSNVTLSIAGLLSGTPALGTAGSYPIAITASSSAGTTKSAQPFTLTVLKPPSVITANLPDATQGQIDYRVQLASTGGAGTAGTATWSLSAGSLPSGLTLSTTGLISGNVVDNPSTQTFQVTATDANGETGVKDLTITVNPPPAVTTGNLPAATQDQTGYFQRLSATGGSGTLSWSVSSGALPAGLTLSNTGIISGNVTANASTQTFTVTATDANRVGGAKVLAITVNQPPAVATHDLGDATPGQRYSQQLSSTGGTGTITWDISSGSLPAGLTMSGAGTISGNVAAPATTQTFTVRATDANAVSGSKAFTIIVNPVVATASLPGGRVKVAYSTALAVSGGTGPFVWTKAAGTLPPGLTLSSDGVISGSPTSGGTSDGLIFRVTDANNRAASSGPLSITVIAPTIAGVALQDGGGTPGQIEPGDRIVVTFAQRMKVNSLCSSWTGDTTNQSLGAADGVVVALQDANPGNDTITVSASGCTLNFGVLDLGAGSYVSGGSATFGGAGNGTAASTVTWDAANFVLTVALGTKGGPGTTATAASSAPALNISAAITDPAGAAIGNSPFSVPSGKQF